MGKGTASQPNLPQNVRKVRRKAIRWTYVRAEMPWRWRATVERGSTGATGRWAAILGPYHAPATTMGTATATALRSNCVRRLSTAHATPKANTKSITKPVAFVRTPAGASTDPHISNGLDAPSTTTRVVRYRTAAASEIISVSLLIDAAMCAS